MSQNKLIVPGFGIGSVFGVPVTVGLAATSTLSITASLVGQYAVSGIVTGIQLNQISTSSGVTGTYSILNGAPGRVFLDGQSGFLVNTTTTASIVFHGG